MSDKPKAFDIVRTHIEDKILDGSYRIGDTLPSERELAVTLEVSRSAVREAIRALEAQGVLASSVGAGGAGGTRIIRARTRALTRLLRLQVALAGENVSDVVELRVALERSSATLAASSASVDDIARLASLVEAMESPDVSMEDFNRLDTEFHVAIANAADNSLIADLTTAVRESLLRPILVAERELDGDGKYVDFRAMLCVQHEGIFAAIQAEDGEAAADLVEAHIRAAYSVLPMLKA